MCLDYVACKLILSRRFIFTFTLSFFPLPSSSPHFSFSLPPYLPLTFPNSFAVTTIWTSGTWTRTSLICSSHPMGIIGISKIWLPSSKNLVHFLLMRLWVCFTTSLGLQFKSHNSSDRSAVVLVWLSLLESEVREAWLLLQVLKALSLVLAPILIGSPIPGCHCPILDQISVGLRFHHCSLLLCCSRLGGALWTSF